MLSFETIVIIIVVSIIAIALIPAIMGSRRKAVEEHLKNLGYEPISIDRKDFHTYHATLRTKHTPGVFTAVLSFPVEYHRREAMSYVKGQEYDTLCITDWIGESPIEQRILERSLNEAPAYIPEDPQERLNFEVSRRLDLITNTPGELMRYDLDQNGQIDPQEWEALRARIRAEVEAELAGQPQATTAPPEEEPSSGQGSSW